ncbi:PucC family protein [Thiorhodovibrio winogradskyi]|uniref:PucC family protein n=1 Tax=Thiorhodovibrio winogradskyi TaxID=77007 RepID=UPI0038B4D752
MDALIGSALSGHGGLALGTWAAVQVTALGWLIAPCGALCDHLFQWPVDGALVGPALVRSSVGNGFVSSLEAVLLFATMIAVGPLMRRMGTTQTRSLPTGPGLPGLP